MQSRKEVPIVEGWRLRSGRYLVTSVRDRGGIWIGDESNRDHGSHGRQMKNAEQSTGLETGGRETGTYD